MLEPFFYIIYFLWDYKATRTSVVELDDFVVGLGLVEGSLGGLAVGAPRLGEDHCIVYIVSSRLSVRCGGVLVAAKKHTDVVLVDDALDFLDVGHFCFGTESDCRCKKGSNKVH